MVGAHARLRAFPFITFHLTFGRSWRQQFPEWAYGCAAGVSGFSQPQSSVLVSSLLVRFPLTHLLNHSRSSSCGLVVSLVTRPELTQ